MYAGVGFRSSEIGDVDVVWHDGLFHLFHLVLPNHDYIAHAVSEDGLVWRRVENALFTSDPGGWDDDMLWTMHVSPDPTQPGCWRMFYTGLSMSEQGRIQRVGAARSSDLHLWKRVDNGYPLEIAEDLYEHRADEGRQWISFRDPYYTTVDGAGWMSVVDVDRDGWITPEDSYQHMVQRGYPDVAERVQELYLAGRKQEAIDAIPDEYVDDAPED